MRNKQVLQLIQQMNEQHTEQVKSMLAAIRPDIARPLLTPDSFTPQPSVHRDPPGRYVTDDTGLDGFFVTDGVPADMSAFKSPWDILQGDLPDDEDL